MKKKTKKRKEKQRNSKGQERDSNVACTLNESEKKIGTLLNKFIF